MQDRDAAEEERRPAALGRWEPPPTSVVLRSGWRVDPERASRGYALALVLASVLVAGWAAVCAARLDALPDEGAAAYRSLTRAAEAVAAAPFVVAAVFVGLMGLGATKRCFGFDRWTALGAAFAALTQLCAVGLPRGKDAFLLQLGVGLAVGLGTAALARTVAPTRSARRRALAAAAYFQLWVFAVQAAGARFLLVRWPSDVHAGQVALAAGASVGASLLAASWLARAATRPG